MNIPKSCNFCKYGYTFDLSVDDLSTHCFILGYTSNWCDDFPIRRDGTLRMSGCPLPDITENQIEIAEIRLKRHKLKRKIFDRMLKGKTKLIKKRNASRLKRMVKKEKKYGVV